MLKIYTEMRVLMEVRFVNLAESTTWKIKIRECWKSPNFYSDSRNFTHLPINKGW